MGLGGCLLEHWTHITYPRVSLACHLSLECLHGYNEQLGVSALHRLQVCSNTRNSLGATDLNLQFFVILLQLRMLKVVNYTGGTSVTSGTLGKGSLGKRPR